MEYAVRFLVFATQSAAIAAAASIDANGIALYQARGYEIINGDVVGKRLSDLSDQPQACRTATWDVPRQRLDGKWVVSHPENNASGSLIINGSPAYTYAMAGVSYDTIESDPQDGSWFPLPLPLP